MIVIEAPFLIHIIYDILALSSVLLILGYDSHLLLPYLTQTKIPSVTHVSVVPRSSEKFLSISINRRITFLDSL